MMLSNILILCGSAYRRNIGEANSCGSDVSLENNIAQLSPYCQKIHVISLYRNDLSEEENITENITVFRVKENKIKHYIHNLHKQNKYTFLITQLLFSDVAIKEGNNLAIPVVYMARSLGFKLDMSINGDYPVSIIIANSKYVANKLTEQYKRKIELISFSLGNTENIIGQANSRPKFDVTIFNPTEAKGGKIFFELVKKYPNLKFRAVLGWTNLKNKDGKYNKKLMRLMELAHTGQAEKVFIPEDYILLDMPNLTVSQPQVNVGNIYQNTRLVIVPSQWEEAFCRVIIESACNNKHVIASCNAGIPEAIKLAGLNSNFLVKDYNNTEAWAKKIQWYFDKGYLLPPPNPKLPKPNLHKILYKYLKHSSQ